MSVKRYRNFLDYWDSRFDENEKILNSYPQLANFTFRECNRLWDHLHSDYAELEARHNALVEARDKLAQEIMRLVNMNEQLHERLAAIVDAVAWERECIDTWEYGTALKMQALDEQVASMRAASAEVDRLIADASAADCEGEG